MIRCYLRGRFQKEFELKKDKLYKLDIAAVGDFVQFELNEDGSGVINKIEERKNYLSRKAPRIKGTSHRGERLEQVIAANIEDLIIVSSVKQPKFNNKFVDRVLVTGESSHLNSIIVINKIDLEKSGKINVWKDLYEHIGYKVIITSVVEGKGIDELKDFITGKVNIFWGQSGAGKSSLLNNMFPDLNLNVGQISEQTQKGKHTTVTSTMEKMSENTFVIDTPGVREIEPFGIRKEDLGHYFVDFQNYINECKFNTCTHSHEPGCGIIKAVENGEISEERYESYLKMLETIEEDINF